MQTRSTCSTCSCRSPSLGQRYPPLPPEVAKIGYVGGYGIYAPGLHAIGAHLPPGLRQTNNTAELYAAIQAIKLFPSGKIAICTDSSLVVLGATGKAKKWELNNWVGSNGPLSNVELWKQLLAELDKSDREIQWIKVPSHVGIVGNEEADALAETGRLSSPLLIQSCASTARHIRRSVPPQRITVRCSTEPNRQDHNPIVVSDSESESESDTEGTELSPLPVPFDTFAPDHIPVTPATPVLPTRDPRSSPARSPGVIPLGASPATQLLTALDLQLLHTPCDRFLPEGFSTPTGSETSVAPLRFDSGDETISMGSDSDSSASTDVSVPRRKRRKHLVLSE